MTMQIKIPIELPDDFCDIVAENLIKKGDAVLVIRCKDCKCYSDGFCNHKQWFDDDNSHTVQESDFCSYAEPKESEDKNNEM